MSTTTTPEMILVVPASVAHAAIHRSQLKNPTSYAEGFYVADADDLAHLSMHGAFTERGPAEDNPANKQLIVYTLVHFRDKILGYTRGKVGQEPRLHAQQSIGVGGHINPEDWDVLLGSSEVFLGAVRRELEEEVNISADHIDTVRFIGLVNEDSTDVGKVHLGLVFMVDLRHVEGLVFEEALLNPCWMDEADLSNNHNLERWSVAVRDAFFSAVRALDAREAALLPHQLRVVQERVALDANIEKLDAFIGGTLYTTLDPAEQNRLNSQRLYMSQYSDVLRERIDAF